MLRNLCLSVTKYYNSLRPSDWSSSFLPFITGLSYLWLYLFNATFNLKTLCFVILFFITSIGFSALGYFLNEYFDIKYDLKTGKVNKLERFSSIQILLLFIIVLLFTITPWFLLVSDTISWALIGIEFFLFFIYSYQLVRIKEIWWLSGIVDSLYAYVIPFLLSFHTSSLHFSEKIDLVTLICFSLALYFVGWRNITLHQLYDVNYDIIVGNITLPAKIGKKRTLKVLLAVTIIETLLFSLLLYLFSSIKIVFWFCLALYVFYLSYNMLSIYLTEKQKIYRTEQYFHITDSFYQIFFPIFCLSCIILNDWRWLLLLAFHFIFLVPTHVKRRCSQIVYWLYRNMFFVPIYIPVQIIGNYFIYYFFRLFGVDLKKEKKSAIEFLKSIKRR